MKLANFVPPTSYLLPQILNHPKRNFSKQPPQYHLCSYIYSNGTPRYRPEHPAECYYPKWTCMYEVEYRKLNRIHR